MKLSELIDKFSDSPFRVTVVGWCSHIPFSSYQFSDHEYDSKQIDWKNCKNRIVRSIEITTYNDLPEIIITLDD